jgi:hypothetical protein
MGSMQQIAAQEVTDLTLMMKWEWMLVNGCKCRSLSSAAMEFLNLFQDGTNASVARGLC